MDQVNLFKKKRTYTNKDGKEVTTYDFFLLCGKSLIPIDARYFKKQDGSPDTKYSSRREILFDYAEVLPDKNNVENPKTQQNV